MKKTNEEEEGGRLLRINKGVELMLRNRRRDQEQPKTFRVCFGKMVALFRREFHIYFEFSFDMKKQCKTLRGK